MGFFSWKTSDTNKSIPNRHSARKTFAVKMLDSDGNAYTEDYYDGYGVFGGVDYYALTAKMNGAFTGETVDELRDIGINMAFAKNKSRYKFPKLVNARCKLKYDELPDSPTCPAQGFFY